MAMNATTLAGALKPEIKSQIATLFGGVPLAGAVNLDQFAEAMAKAIANKVVDHIQTFAVVTVNGVQGGIGSATGTIA